MNELSIAAAARECPERLALVIGTHHYSYAQLAELAAAKRSLIADHHRLAIVAEPTIDAVAFVLAAIELEIPVVPLHPALPRADREKLRALAGAHFPDEAPSAEPPSPARTPGELSVIFTSGSTGEPKGVVLSRRAFLASAAASAANLGWRDDDRWLCPLSWAHVGGLSVLVRTLVARRTAVLLQGEVGSEALTQAFAQGITLASMVPAQLAALLEARPSFEPSANLRAILLGGAASHPDLLARARARGLPVLTTYGMSETCSQVATAPLGEPVPSGAVGRALRGIDIDIVAGEIVVSGPTLMSGYLNEDPLAGPLFTGDLGRLTNGWLFVEGRKDARINSGGMRVDPVEVEGVLGEVEGVTRACVFGIEDARWGQVVCAAIVTTGPKTEALVSRIVEHCRTRLVSAKRPRRLAIVSSLPETGSGKLARKAIAEQTECDIRLSYGIGIR